MYRVIRCRELILELVVQHKTAVIHTEWFENMLLHVRLKWFTADIFHNHAEQQE
ncbi:hypothetical protein D3C76_1264160 [compost metagenome]